ncbi:hypothetical protein GQX74_010455 [Glossina fuscipes]|nr:hypothetical protein GQX74_010455 [Glossina fuscipes]
MRHSITATLCWRIWLLFITKLKSNIKANAKEVIEKTASWSAEAGCMPHPLSSFESILFVDHSDKALRLPNGDINVSAFDRMAAIVGAFTKHMHAVKTTEAPTNSEYETFCRHMQKITKMAENGSCMIATAAEILNRSRHK